jgi:translocator protein
MDRSRPILVILATIGVIAFNWLAAVGRVNNVTPEAISAKYPTVITPAGYAFSIWSLIYFGLIVFSIYQALPKNLEKFRSIRTVYILSCVLNCAWIYAWHGEMILICLAVIAMLAASLLFIDLRLKNNLSYGDYWAANVPFGIYFGWVTAAMIVNSVIALGVLGVDVSGPAATWVGVIAVLIAAAIGVFVRVKLIDYFFPLAIAWALTGIGVKQSGKTLIVSAAAVGVVACLIATCSFVMNLNSSISPKAGTNE